MKSWEKWLLGIFSALLIAWAGRVESKLDLTSRLEERLAAMQRQLDRIESKLE